MSSEADLKPALHWPHRCPHTDVAGNHMGGATNFVSDMWWLKVTADALAAPRLTSVSLVEEMMVNLHKISNVSAGPEDVEAVGPDREHVRKAALTAGSPPHLQPVLIPTRDVSSRPDAKSLPDKVWLQECCVVTTLTRQRSQLATWFLGGTFISGCITAPLKVQGHISIFDLI